MGFEKRIISHRGVTVIQKRDPSVRTLRPGKVALVLAGGGISGGAYKAGGLKALDEFFARRLMEGGRSSPFGLSDADLFIGLSAGSVLATFLAAGVRPEALADLLSSPAGAEKPVRPWHFMWPNVNEIPKRIGTFLEKEQEIVTHYLSGATSGHTGKRFSLGQTLAKMSASATRLLPTGLFDSGRLKAYLERTLDRLQIPNQFQALHDRTGKSLYMAATDLNRGRLVVFGHDEPYGEVPICDAITASCALPLWYRPVRIENPRSGQPDEPAVLDLVDGAVLRTANIRLAVEKGAELVICYNPITHIVYDRVGRSLYEHGAYAIASQVVRILLGARLHQAKELIYSSNDYPVDVVFIEPASDDYYFFLMNPLSYRNAQKAAEHGYRSVREALVANRSVLTSIFGTHGIEITDPAPAHAAEADPGQPVEMAESQRGKGP